MSKLCNIHLGEILEKEFLKPTGITPHKLSQATNVSQTRTSQILKGKRRITADTALRLSKFFGPSTKFWLGTQNEFDIEAECNNIKKKLELIQTWN